MASKDITYEFELAQDAVAQGKTRAQFILEHSTKMTTLVMYQRWSMAYNYAKEEMETVDR